MSPPVTRRAAVGGMLGLGALTLPDVLRLRASEPRRATGVILLFAHGGPSHLETYDLKPDAPDTIRGPFRPIDTSVPGVRISEHLPKQARLAHRFALVRSVGHDQPNHFEGHARFLSGYGGFKPGTSESFHPMVGAVANRYLDGRVPGVPAAVAINGVCLNGPDYSPGVAQGFWPAHWRVPITGGGLRDAQLRGDRAALADRLGLLARFDAMRRDADTSGALDALDAHRRRAVEVLTTDAARRAFDLSREDPRTRDRYGDSAFGREALLARRLVEAGVGFVSVRVPGGGPGSTAHDWDDHAVNWDMPTAMKARLPLYDHVVAALIDDVYDRGLDRDVLVVVTGEFGRTPRLEQRDGRIGRDHYPAAMSILVAGGGIPTGQVVGATNRYGEHPTDRPLDPHDVLATVYRHLGIDHAREYPDLQGRPFPLTRGTPIAELV